MGGVTADADMGFIPSRGTGYGLTLWPVALFEVGDLVFSASSPWVWCVQTPMMTRIGRQYKTVNLK